ncbi:MAG: cytochrome c3 family protein [Gemmatimonadaceae bacterium]
MRRLFLIAWAALAMPLAAQTPGYRAPGPFPHAKHAKLFPTCEGCHAGIVNGRADRIMPTVAQCEACHNGRDTTRVTWTPPTRPVAGLLRFSHPDHASKVDSAGKACESCHTDSGAGRMDVHPPRPDGCFSCHTHRATAHYDESNRCSTCHVPLTRATALSAARVADLPKPSSHNAADFGATHGTGTLTSCQTCHARESCVRCHMNGTSVRAISALDRDARIAGLVRTKAAVYYRPTGHTASDFVIAHGAEATRDVGKCASCHARPSCRTCHTGLGAAKIINQLPAEPTAPGEGRGVQLKHVAPLPAITPASWGALPHAAAVAPADTGVRGVRVHSPGFERNHAGVARAGTMTCEGCHTQTMCAQCHNGERSRRYHVANFAMRHSADAYARETNCSSCHNAEVFCRSCHRETGVGSRGTTSGVFHTAQPQWLLQHGQAARQGLSTCASCHQQRDCMQCHSTLGWGVSPHGPGFDAARLWKQAKPMCLRCHLSDPLTR